MDTPEEAQERAESQTPQADADRRAAEKVRVPEGAASEPKASERGEKPATKKQRRPTEYVVKEEAAVFLAEQEDPESFKPSGPPRSAWIELGTVEGSHRGEAKAKALELACSPAAGALVGHERQREEEKVGRLQLTPVSSWDPSKPKVRVERHVDWE